jgi:hypothetical protein
VWRARGLYSDIYFPSSNNVVPSLCYGGVETVKIKVEGTYLTPEQRKNFERNVLEKKKTSPAKADFSEVFRKVLGKSSIR